MPLVSDILRVIVEYCRDDHTEFVKAVQEAQKRAGQLEILMCKIYEDSSLGKLPDARYAALDVQYAKEQDELSAEITELEQTQQLADAGATESRAADRYCRLIWKFSTRYNENKNIFRKNET